MNSGRGRGFGAGPVKSDTLTCLTSSDITCHLWKHPGEVRPPFDKGIGPLHPRVASTLVVELNEVWHHFGGNTKFVLIIKTGIIDMVVIAS